MDHEMLVATIKYLKSVINFDPVVNPQNMGECIYCGVALDEGREHEPDCHYLEAKRLLKGFEAQL